MRILSLLILNAVVAFAGRQTDSPHGADFKISCSKCHSPSGWQLDKKIYSFDHNTTNLPLVGQHTDVSCRQCHQTLVFRDAGTECNGCHNDVHQSTVGSDCSRCHTPVTWLVDDVTPIHQRSRFPLLGAHKTADCSDCHKSESSVRFDVTGVNCIDCHRNDYQSAKKPDHVQAGFPEDCIFCHKITSSEWSESDFRHNLFPLEQGHSSVQCNECHKTGNFSDAGRECYSCHQQDYVNAVNPDHDASQLPTNCEECHTVAPGWQPTTFDHSGFPLTFGHSGPSCIECHTGGNYTSLSSDCYSCHQTDFEGSANPNHQAAGFSNVCLTCHSTNPGWIPTTFSHNFFPLTLGHSTPVCIDCHVGENYTTTPTDCYDCHQSDYTSATNPNHLTAGFPHECEVCHTVNPGWQPASFNHTTFPLTLGHAGPVCADCHIGGNYVSTPTDCFACHQDDYNSSVNPDHQVLAFSEICTQCHTTNPGWQPATYLQHDAQFFPVYSGKHKNQWDACADCHTDPSSYKLFSCISCHEHNKTDMDDEHSGKPGYSYISIACYQCHPRGVAD